MACTKSIEKVVLGLFDNGGARGPPKNPAPGGRRPPVCLARLPHPLLPTTDVKQASSRVRGCQSRIRVRLGPPTVSAGVVADARAAAGQKLRFRAPPYALKLSVRAALRQQPGTPYPPHPQRAGVIVSSILRVSHAAHSLFLTSLSLLAPHFPFASAALDETILLDQDTFGKKEKLKLSQVKDGIFFVMFR